MAHNLSEAVVSGLFPRNQMQAVAEPFVWGKGGRRMTPQDITREREIAASLMQPDYSPVQHWTQGLARVAGNVTGALQDRAALKASDANADYSRQIAASLSNPSGTPSASAPPGSGQSLAPGGDPARLMQIVADPYVDRGTKALAQMQLEQAQAIQMKQMEWANREQPEIVQLATLANDPNQPEHVRKAAQGRMQILNDPMAIIPGLPIGTYVGPQSGVAAALGGGGQSTDAPDTLPPDFFDSAPSVADAPPPISAARAEAELKKARAEGDAEMRRLMGGR